MTIRQAWTLVVLSIPAVLATTHAALAQGGAYAPVAQQEAYAVPAPLPPQTPAAGQLVPAPFAGGQFGAQPAYYEEPTGGPVGAVVPAGWNDHLRCGQCAGGCVSGPIGNCPACGGMCGGSCLTGGAPLYPAVEGGEMFPAAGCGAGAGCGTCGGDGYALGQFAGYAGQHLGGQHGPFGSGGCCAPRWFDVHAEWMYLQRDQISRRVDFTSDGILGPIVLSTDDLSFHEQSGFRATAAFLVGPSTALEATYFGTFNWASSQEVQDPDGNLYSVFSDFGSLPFDGFLETDASFFQQIEYSSDLDNGELNLRRRWVSANCVLHGSWLAGVRYLRLTEDFRYVTMAVRDDVEGDLDYLVSTTNNLIGFQLGTDLFVCLSPRLKVGVEVEAGVYGNRAKQETGAQFTTGPGTLQEEVTDSDAAFLGEAGFLVLFRVTPRMTLRAGYQLLYLNGVALAPENFNDQPPFLDGPRTPLLNHNGEAFYLGGTAGFEWTW